MRCTLTSLFFATASLLLAPGLASAVSVNWTSIGNPANPADPINGYGSVTDPFKIGTYEVTNSQYVEFLNSKDRFGSNTLGLYNASMANTSLSGGISFTPANPNGSKYAAIAGQGNRPVTHVNVYDAMRFANWMNNGQLTGSSTETGAYVLLGNQPIPTNTGIITREAGAQIFLPSAEEWYKAAYFNAAGNSYFTYPTASNSAPNDTTPTGVPNSVNSTSAVGHTTEVGAYTGTASPYSVFDMGGNVFEFTDFFPLFADGDQVAIRGSSWFQDNATMYSTATDAQVWFSEFEASYGGFRLAAVPEPSSFILAVFGLAALAAWESRKRHRD